jgi:phosphate starvation-inducible protein PhoH
MRTIGLPEDGLEALFGVRDVNLKHIESVMGVRMRTQGTDVLVEGDPITEASVEALFDQLGEASCRWVSPGQR